MKQLYTQNIMFRLAILLAGLFATTASHAQIYYQDINPDKTLDTWDSYDLKLDSAAGAHLAYGAPGNLSVWNDGGTDVNVNAFSDCQVGLSGSLPAVFNAGDVISSATSWMAPSYSVLNNGSSGNWVGMTDKYLAVRIKEAGQWIYGWVRLDVNTAGTSVTIKDYACNKQPGASINAGQLPTGVCGPALEGFSFTVDHKTLKLDALPFNQQTAVAVTDMTGRKLTATFLVASGAIDLSSLGTGCYMIHLESNGRQASFKIII